MKRMGSFFSWIFGGLVFIVGVCLYRNVFAGIIQYGGTGDTGAVCTPTNLVSAASLHFNRAASCNGVGGNRLYVKSITWTETDAARRTKIWPTDNSDMRVSSFATSACNFLPKGSFEKVECGIPTIECGECPGGSITAWPASNNAIFYGFTSIDVSKCLPATKYQEYYGFMNGGSIVNQFSVNRQVVSVGSEYIEFPTIENCFISAETQESNGIYSSIEIHQEQFENEIGDFYITSEAQGTQCFFVP